MSLIEAIAAALGVINVLLVARRSVWNYPPGIAMVALYFFVFADARLYSDALLQIFFLVIQLYGWWNWVHCPKVAAGVAVEWMTPKDRVRWFAGTLVFTVCWGVLMDRYTDAAAPLIDAGVAVFSICAQILLSLRKVENWLVWITVDLVAIGLFLSRGLVVTACLYSIFLIIAVFGFLKWMHRAPRRTGVPQ